MYFDDRLISLIDDWKCYCWHGMYPPKIFESQRSEILRRGNYLPIWNSWIEGSGKTNTYTYTYTTHTPSNIQFEIGQMNRTVYD